MTKPSALFDQNGVAISVPTKGIATIAADTDLATYGHSAIMCNSDMTIYFGSESGTTMIWPANTPFTIHQTNAPKLSAEALCFTI